MQILLLGLVRQHNLQDQILVFNLSKKVVLLFKLKTKNNSSNCIQIIGSSANAPANTVPGQRMFVSNPTYSKGNTVTDEDLEKLSEALFIKDSNNANKHITLNLQKKTTGSSTTDEAPQP